MRHAILLMMVLMMGVAGCQSVPRKPLAKVEQGAMSQEREAVLPDGQKLELPAPVLWPAGGEKTPAFARWSDRGDHTVIDLTDSQGRPLKAEMGFVFTKEGDSQPYAGLFKVARYRADGTLETATRYTPMGTVTGWTTYGPDGKTPLLSVSQVESKIGPWIRAIEEYDAEGKVTKRYSRNRGSGAFQAD